MSTISEYSEHGLYLFRLFPSLHFLISCRTYSVHERLLPGRQYSLKHRLPCQEDTGENYSSALVRIGEENIKKRSFFLILTQTRGLKRLSRGSRAFIRSERMCVCVSLYVTKNHWT